MSPVAAPQTAAYRVGPFLVDVHRRQVLRAGEPLALTHKAFDALLLLLHNRERVVEKDELLATVWPDAFVSEDSLTQAISSLRKALGDDPGQPTYIATVPRRGYRFVGAAEAIEEPQPDEAHAPSQPLMADAVLSDAHAANAPRVGAASATAMTPLAAHPWRYASIAVVAVIAMLLIVRTALVAPRGGTTGGAIRFVQTMPDGTQLASGGELSPDGRFLTFAAQDLKTGVIHLWLRPLDLPTPRQLPGTEGAFRPFWSPDSQSIAFFADGKLKRIGVSGTPAQTLASVGYRPSGGTWSSRGVILYSDRLSRLFTVPDNGGTPEPASTLDAALGEIGHQNAHFLPDGEHFLFSTNTVDPEHAATYIGTIGSTERIRVLDSTARQAIYAAPGYLLYVKDHVLFAQRFDVTALRVTGAPIVIPAVNAAIGEGEARPGAISASTNGVLVFGGDLPPNHLAWFDRSGRELEQIAVPLAVHNPTLSPDRRSLLADGSSGVWLIDLQRGAPTRLIPDGSLSGWSPDGTRVVFMARRNGAAAIYTHALADHDLEAPLVTSNNEMKIPGNWSPDRRYFVYASSNPQTRLDLWTLPADSPASEPRAFLRSPSNELHPQISPDGRWLAYSSDESGSWEVYVQSFPAAGHKQTISVGGGAQPQWRRDGGELYYIAPDGMLMAVAVRDGASLDVDRPRPLFHVPIAADIISLRNQYVADDGTRFIVDVRPDLDPLNVLVNWTSLVNP